jgi:LacI family transcriptional regulator
LEAEHPDWLQAEFDHEAMMSQAVHHLKSLGHHKIAYFGFNFGLVYERRLLAGFLDAVGTASSLWVADLSDETRSVRESLEMWFSGPVESWPTAAVSAAGPLTLKTLELWLAGRGIRISDDGGGFAVFGRSSHDYPLIYGQAFGFLDSDVVILARRITQELLLPVLRGEKPAKPILRLLPTMSQLPSHEITSDPPRGWKEK